jgi:cytochrome c
MMKRFLLAAVALALPSAPALAGDAAAGATAFASQCANCHHVISPEGEVFAGRAQTRTGPNLYGVIGRQAGVVDGFRYGPSIVAAGNGGLVWDEQGLAAYMQDPQGYLRQVTGDNRARSQMSFRVRTEDAAVNIAAFLAQYGPEPEPEAEGEATPEG